MRGLEDRKYSQTYSITFRHPDVPVRQPLKGYIAMMFNTEQTYNNGETKHICHVTFSVCRLVREYFHYEFKLWFPLSKDVQGRPRATLPFADFEQAVVNGILADVADAGNLAGNRNRSLTKEHLPKMTQDYVSTLLLHSQGFKLLKYPYGQPNTWRNHEVVEVYDLPIRMVDRVDRDIYSVICQRDIDGGKARRIVLRENPATACL